MHKTPENWKSGTRDGAGKVKHPRDDLRLAAVRQEGLKPEERRTRQTNFKCTETLKAAIIRLVKAHGIRVHELMALAIRAFEEKYGSGPSRNQP